MIRPRPSPKQSRTVSAAYVAVSRRDPGRAIAGLQPWKVRRLPADRRATWTEWLGDDLRLCTTMRRAAVFPSARQAMRALYQAVLDGIEGDAYEIREADYGDLPGRRGARIRQEGALLLRGSIKTLRKLVALRGDQQKGTA